MNEQIKLLIAFIVLSVFVQIWTAHTSRQAAFDVINQWTICTTK